MDTSGSDGTGKLAWTGSTTAPTGRKWAADEPNVVWTIDFKGQFRTQDGRLCYPLTLQDAHSRFLLDIRGLDRITTEGARRVCTRVFREFGIPDRIRSDNGQPFASHALGRLSQLSVWWIELGIRPEQIQPGKPQQNGRHERMHRTLKARTAQPPRKNLRAQQRRFDEFRKVFNDERPHEALDLETPASRYQPSPRSFPERPVEPEYPDHFEIRRVSQMGSMRWKCRGSASAIYSAAEMWDSRKSATESGLCTSAPFTWVGWTNVTFALWMSPDAVEDGNVKDQPRTVCKPSAACSAPFAPITSSWEYRSESRPVLPPLDDDDDPQHGDDEPRNTERDRTDPFFNW